MARFSVADHDAGIVRALEKVIGPFDLDADILHAFFLVAAALLAFLPCWRDG
jgi:hypothetical protein